MELRDAERRQTDAEQRHEDGRTEQQVVCHAVHQLTSPRSWQLATETH